ncbi:MAG: glycosyltransferase family 39 protein [Patescibacteria group bacterium]|nr:glycosyltransferase family 39 protein [Patescibacteria group bacterium]MDD5554442.1 glycosyltransferase family 39 protein [Patescibacteria group bacterium]
MSNNFVRRYLKKIGQAIKDHCIIISIILVAFFVRFYGIYFDYPYRPELIWDEFYQIKYLLNVIEAKSLFATSSGDPALLAFLYFPVLVLRIIFLALREGIYNLDELKGYLVENGMGQIHIIIRWYSVFFGTATVYLIYRIYKLIFKHKLSYYYPALVYSFGLIPVFLSHWGKTHSAIVFFLVLSLFFIIRFEKEGKIKYFYWSVIAAACSFSVHIIGLSAIIFPLSGFVFNRFNIFKKRNDSLQKPQSNIINNKILIKSSLFFIGIVGFFYSFILKDFIPYLAAEGADDKILPAIGIKRLYYLVQGSFNIEPIFISLFFIILVFNFKNFFRNRYLRYIIVGILFNYLLMATVFALPMRSRLYLTFITLAVPLAAGYLIELFYSCNEKIKRKKTGAILMSVFIILLILPSIILSAHWLIIVKNNTEIETVDWLQKNLNQGEIIYSFDNLLAGPLSYEAALWHKENNKVEESVRVNFILDHKSDFAGKGLDLRYDFKNNRYETLGGQGTKYVIIYYWFTKKTVENQPGRFEKEKAYDILENIKKYHNLKLVKTFFPTSDTKLIEMGIMDYLNNPLSWPVLLKLEKSGPFIEIYEVLN